MWQLLSCGNDTLGFAALLESRRLPLFLQYCCSCCGRAWGQAPSFTVNPHNKDVYSAYNKPEAVIDWLQHVEPEEDYILIIDADMIMRKPFDPIALGARPGWAVSAYYGYMIGVNNKLADKHIPEVPRRNDTLAGPYGRRSDQVWAGPGSWQKYMGALAGQRSQDPVLPQVNSWEGPRQGADGQMDKTGRLLAMCSVYATTGPCEAPGGGGFVVEGVRR
jgi:hypothetical protein